MKNIILTTIIAFITLACKAQTVGLDAKYGGLPLGAYFKDLNNEMDKYVGTWQYINGNDTLTIVIQKKIHVLSGLGYYEDLLIGEYRYISNGVVIVNTLPLLDNTTLIGRDFNISGKLPINRYLWVKCLECGVDEKRFALGFWDPERPYLTSTKIVFRYLPLALNENGSTSPIRMTATILATHGVSIPTEDSPVSPRVPYGEYLMVKQ